MTSIVTTSMATQNIIDAAIPSFSVAMIGFLVFLVSKELATNIEEPRSRLFKRHLNVAVIPLLIVFFSIVIMNIVDLL